MTKQTMQNRRSDKRITPPDLQVRARKSGLRESHEFVECTAIDTSINGLAFSSSELDLELLQKVDIELYVGRRSFKGQAVVCDIHSGSKEKRYGVLYIDLKPSLQEAFGIKSIFAAQISEVAVSMADNVLINPNLDEDERNLRKARLMMFDGVEAFKNRLCDRAGTLDYVPYTPEQLASLFEFEGNLASVTVPLFDHKKETLGRSRITPELETSTGQVIFRSDNGNKYSTLIELLQELSDTFSKMLAE